jgi:hypothetical protein
MAGGGAAKAAGKLDMEVELDTLEGADTKPGELLVVA